MTILQRVDKVSKYGAAATLTLFGLLTLAALTPHPGIEKAAHKCETTIYVAGDVIHASFLLPVQTASVNWRQHIDAIPEDRRFIGVGWGDHDFYLNTLSIQELNPATAAKSLFWPTSSVLQILPYRSVPRSTAAYQIHPVCISEEGYQKLAAYILDSFTKDDTGQPTKVTAPYRNKGQFYYAKGRYSIVKTCNDWLAQGLRLANVRTPLWSGTALAIFHHLDQQ